MIKLSCLATFLILLSLNFKGFSLQSSKIDSLMLVLTQTNNEEDKVRTLIKLARATYDRDSSISFARQAFVLSTSDTSKALSANQLAWELKSNHKLDSAKIYIEVALKASKNIEQSLETSDILNTYASIYYNQGNYDSAIFMHKQALGIRRKIDDKRAIAVSLNNLSIIYEAKGDREKATKMVKESIAIYAELKLWKEMADSNLNLGNGYANIGELDSAHLFFQNALKGYDSLGLRNLKTYALINLAFICNDLSKYQEAKKYLLETRDIQLELGNFSILGYAYQGLGSVALEENNLDSALINSETGLDYFTKANSAYGRALCLHNLGRVNLLQDKFNEALDFLNQAMEIRKKLGIPDGMAKLEISLGSVYFAIQDFESANVHFQNALNTSTEIQNISVIKEAYLGLYETFAKQKKFKNALNNYVLYDQFNDSLVNENNLAKIEELNVQYGTEKKVQQIKLQEVAIAQEKAANERKLIFIIGLIILLLLVIVIGLLLKNRMQKQQELTLKQKEIEYKELQLNAVIESQEKERKRFSQDIHDGFGQLISVLKLNVQTIEQEDDKDRRHELFEKSSDVLSDMYKELKNICFNLMPQSLVQFGLVPPIRELADKINLSEKVFVDVLIYDMDDRLSELQEISIYRIVQEWVNNILKYSDATKVTIQLTRDDDEITLTIEDNGTGFEASKLMSGSGNGWKNIKSRTNLIKGELELDTTPGLAGNMLSINIPCVGVEKVIIPSALL